MKTHTIAHSQPLAVGARDLDGEVVSASRVRTQGTMPPLQAEATIVIRSQL